MIKGRYIDVKKAPGSDGHVFSVGMVIAPRFVPKRRASAAAPVAPASLPPPLVAPPPSPEPAEPDKPVPMVIDESIELPTDSKQPAAEAAPSVSLVPLPPPPPIPIPVVSLPVSASENNDKDVFRDMWTSQQPRKPKPVISLAALMKSKLFKL